MRRLLNASQHIVLYFIMLFVLVLSACTNQSNTSTAEKEPEEKEEYQLFTSLPPDSTGVNFKNQLADDNDRISPFVYINAYNGGGVAIGDINNDGFSDIYFTGNNVLDRLYLNQGNMKFINITEGSGANGGEGWSSGVTMADVNADGYLDIYVSRGYFFNDDWRRANILYINNQDGTFTDKAKEYGIDDPGLSVQSTFFDYDRDGDLDLYVGNHPWKYTLDFQYSKANTSKPSYKDSDHFYRNNGDGTFTDVTDEAGIRNFGFILGLVVSDYDKDGWPDIYVANDHMEPDKFYRNNGDGTFTNIVDDVIKHTCKFSMGVDMADFNNDAYPDIVNVDMAAADNYREKSQMAGMNPDDFWLLVDEGYGYSYMRNMLQVNNGNGSFSEIGQMAGITKTDWSWAALFADFDNDSHKDLYITNGYPRDIKDKDFLILMEKENESRAIGGANPLSKLEWAERGKDMLASTRIPNYYFENNGDLTFASVADKNGLGFKGFSNGAAYGDLDNDGDLDLVVSNVNDIAHVYKNNTIEQGKSGSLRIKLVGEGTNGFAFGTKVTIKIGDELQYQELTATRGFQSSVEPIVHFGIGNATVIDELFVEWPDGRNQKIMNQQVMKGRILGLFQQNATAQSNVASIEPIFEDFPSDQMPKFKHTENEYNDYDKEVLLPHKMSQFGPGLAKGDVNGDGLEDFFVGGALGQSGNLYIQVSNGRFQKSTSNTWEQDLLSEDLGVLFFDADQDQDLDLYVVSGGNEFPENGSGLQDRLYINDGKGNFTRELDRLPIIRGSGSCVTTDDFDQDGDLDLFVGGRLVPGKYPLPARSYILQNDKGHFKDVTKEIAPDLHTLGLVTSSVWTDFNQDGWTDLVVTGEWMTIEMYKNTEGVFEKVNISDDINNAVGWWNKLVAADFDGDGDEDLVAGNLGTNYKYQASVENPFHVYCHDFDDSGSLDIVLGYFNEGNYFPVRGKQCSSEQMPALKKKWPTYDAFARATLVDIYGEDLQEALHYEAREFRTSYLENMGNGKFEMRALPNEAQFSTVNGIITYDFNRDGNLDILMAGNLFVSEVETGRADAGTGLLMTGDGKGNFNPVPVTESGFFADKDVKDIQLINADSSNPIILVANNDDVLEMFRLK